jgi:hypothetical protein
MILFIITVLIACVCGVAAGTLGQQIRYGNSVTAAKGSLLALVVLLMMGGYALCICDTLRQHPEVFTGPGRAAQIVTTETLVDN